MHALPRAAFLPLPSGERVGVWGPPREDLACEAQSHQSKITQLPCRLRQAQPLTPTLSSLLKAAHIHVLSPRAPEGRGGKAVRRLFARGKLQIKRRRRFAPPGLPASPAWEMSTRTGLGSLSFCVRRELFAARCLWKQERLRCNGTLGEVVPSPQPSPRSSEPSTSLCSPRVPHRGEGEKRGPLINGQRGKA
jgi:hypothetical protein